MTSLIRQYERPATVAQAVQRLRQAGRGAAPLVACPRLPDNPFPAAAAVIDLQALGLDYVTADDAVLRIGALAPLQALVDSPQVQPLAQGVLAQAAYLAAHFGLRNLATVAGAVTGVDGGLSGPPEVLLTLLALDAEAVVQGDQMRRVPLATYEPSAGELLIELSVPRPAGAGGGLARVARTPLDWAMVAAVAVVTPATARVAVAGASPQPMVAEVALGGPADRIADRLAEAVDAGTQPESDVRAGADYRRAMARVLTRRAVDQALANRGGS
jgi:CO/xanthine dehydrogenase FAD-binding subunit